MDATTPTTRADANGAAPLHIGQLRIIEVSTSLSGAFVGKMALDLGADVIRLAAESGPAARDASWLDRGKPVMTFPTARLAEEAVALGADAVIWDDLYGALGRLSDGVRDAAAYTLELSGSLVSPGPWSEATLLAEAGIAHLTGRREGPPVPLPGHQVAMLAGCNGFAALAGAVLSGLASTASAHLRLAAIDMLAGLHQFSLIDYVCNGRIRKRNGRRWANNHPIGTTYPCADGHIAICAATDQQFAALCILLDVPELIDDPRFRTATTRFENADDMDAIIEPLIAPRTREDLFTNGNSIGIPIAPVAGPDDLLTDANLAQRRFWREDGEVKTPDLGVRPIPTGTLPARPPAGRRLPLEGVRIVEFTKVWAGPLAGRALADLGAEVVRIDSPFSRGPAVIPAGASIKPMIFPNDEPGERPWNRQGITNILHRSKKDVCLDIKDPRARQIAADLCAQADVVLDNNRPGALDRSGLGYEAVSQRNPGVIFVGMSGYGALNSLYRDYPAYGPVTESMGGLTWWTREESDPETALPSGMGFPDPIIAAVATARVAAALNTRLATGRGEFIDLSQVECTAMFIGDLVDRWQRTDPANRDWRMGLEPGSSAREPGTPGDYLVTTGDPGSETDVDALREAGIAAAWDNSAPEVLDSPELATFWVDLHHPDVGTFRYDGNPFLAGGERLPLFRFPSLGEHNREVLQAWLGMSDEQCDRLEAEGVIASSPRPPVAAGAR